MKVYEAKAKYQDYKIKYKDNKGKSVKYEFNYGFDILIVKDIKVNQVNNTVIIILA